MIKYLKTRIKPRPAVMYSSLRAVNCSAPAVSRTSSYIRKISGRNDIETTSGVPQGRCNSEGAQTALATRGGDDAHPCHFSVDLDGLPVFL